MTTFAQLIDLLGGLGQVLDLRHAAGPLGDWFKARERAIFDTAGTAGGHPEFVPLAASTIANKRRLGQSPRPLIATGAMRRDFASGGAVEASAERVTLGPAKGTSNAYAFRAVRNNPHRDPVPALTPAERSRVLDVIVETFREQIGSQLHA